MSDKVSHMCEICHVKWHFAGDPDCALAMSHGRDGMDPSVATRLLSMVAACKQEMTELEATGIPD